MRPIDSEHRETTVVTFRITRPLADALDAEVARLVAKHPGIPIGRGVVARIALMRALLDDGPKLEWCDSTESRKVRS
jgi:hypothetical protein